MKCWLRKEDMIKMANYIAERMPYIIHNNFLRVIVINHQIIKMIINNQKEVGISQTRENMWINHKLVWSKKKRIWMKFWTLHPIMSRIRELAACSVTQNMISTITQFKNPKMRTLKLSTAELVASFILTQSL